MDDPVLEYLILKIEGAGQKTVSQTAIASSLHRRVSSLSRYGQLYQIHKLVHNTCCFQVALQANIPTTYTLLIKQSTDLMYKEIYNNNNYPGGNLVNP